MTSALLQGLLQGLAILSALLLVGAFLRAKVPLFRKLLLPASVIGGFIGLLLGPQVLGTNAILAFPEEFINTWSLLPGILIVPIFAAVPLGMFMHQKKKESGVFKKTLPKVLVSCGLFSAAGGVQTMIGFGFTLIAAKLMPSLNLYRTFGYELSQGFSGGHGTAGGVGNILEGLGLDYWATAQGVAITFATVGLIGGMLIGIYLINRAAAKGQTAMLSKPGELPPLTAYGFTKDISAQPNMGRETTNSSSIETITVHLAIMLVDCGLAYWLLGLAKTYKVPGLSSIPVWFYGLLIMYGINFIMIKLKLDWMIDTKVKARITGTMSDIAIVAAIASVPVKAVAAYVGPMIILSVLGFIFTYLVCFPLFRFCFGKDDFPFERAIMSWGVNTGVMINGMMLLKICDPDYDTPVLNDFSMGFSLMSIIMIFTSPITYGLIATGSTFANFAFGTINCIGYFIMALVGRAMLKKMNKSELQVTTE